MARLFHSCAPCVFMALASCLFDNFSPPFSVCQKMMLEYLVAGIKIGHNSLIYAGSDIAEWECRDLCTVASTFNSEFKSVDFWCQYCLTNLWMEILLLIVDTGNPQYLSFAIISFSLILFIVIQFWTLALHCS